MTLPEGSFFELLRTVFGKIKTPFNKQILMGDLEKFLLRDDIRKNIANYIDKNDARIIVAVATLNEPAPADLETFFVDELNPSELRDMVINLEERFIIYRFIENDAERQLNGHRSNGQKPEARTSRLALNPVLESILSPFIMDKTLLFPSVSIDEAAQNKTNKVPQEKTQDKFLFDDRILAALLSFVSQNREFFRVGGGIRQKVGNAANALFPGLADAGLSLETLIGGLQVLGLFFAEDENLVPDHRRFAAFGGLSRHERLAYCAAGILCYTDFNKGAHSKEGASSREDSSSKKDVQSATFSTWLFRAKIKNYAEIICRLYQVLDPQRLYPRTTLQKMAYIQDGDNTIVNIIDIMEKIGLLVPASDIYWRKAMFTESALSGESASSECVIAMDTPFTVLVYPEIAYNDVVSLAIFSDIIEAGMTVRFELSRDSVVAAFNLGFPAEAIIELLQRLSHNRISENLSFTLNDWEKRHGEVTFRRGLVLTLSPEQCHLAQTKPLAKLITETLAPGVYLMPESEEEKAVQALGKAGVAIIGRRVAQFNDKTSGSEESSGLFRSFFPSLHAAGTVTGASAEKKSSVFTINDDSASILIKSFHSILDTMSSGREERDELSARIDRRLVLCESQLKDAVVRYEKLEARGLDYAGKALIAKQALAMQSPVEVIWPGKQKQDRVMGIPKTLEKAGSETVLVIGSSGEGDIRIPLGKISSLRRIKKSIFEGG